jgi:hypothetical protein
VFSTPDISFLSTFYSSNICFWRRDYHELQQELQSIYFHANIFGKRRISAEKKKWSYKIT